MSLEKFPDSIMNLSQDVDASWIRRAKRKIYEIMGLRKPRMKPKTDIVATADGVTAVSQVYVAPASRAPKRDRTSSRPHHRKIPRTLEDLLQRRRRVTTSCYRYVRRVPYGTGWQTWIDEPCTESRSFNRRIVMGPFTMEIDAARRVLEYFNTHYPPEVEPEAPGALGAPEVTT